MDEVFIPITAITILFGVLPALTLYYLNKMKSKKYATLIKLAEIGGDVNPEMLKMLDSGGASGYKSDYRLGLIWLAIDIPITLGIMTTPDAEGVAFALIPAFVGIAYIISGKLRLREPDKD